MIRLFKAAAALMLAAALGWTGWWVLAARGQEAALALWFDARGADGWQAEFGGIETGGFPGDFITRIAAPALADPAAGWAWSAPELRLERPATDPTHVTARFPARQQFAVPGERATIESRSMDAILALFPGLDLRLREGTLVTRGLVVAGQSGWRAGAETLDVSVRRRALAGEPPETHQVEALAERVLLPDALMKRLDPTGLLASEVTVLSLSGLVVPDRPLDRRVIEAGGVGFRTLVVRKAELDWDGMALTAAGRLDADAQGLAEGEIALSLGDWRRLMALARSSGALGSDVADAVEGALGFVALLNRSDRLDVTVSFADGRARIGPVPVGAAPRMRAP